MRLIRTVVERLQALTSGHFQKRGVLSLRRTRSVGIPCPDRHVRAVMATTLRVHANIPPGPIINNVQRRLAINVHSPSHASRALVLSPHWPLDLLPRTRVLRLRDPQTLRVLSVQVLLTHAPAAPSSNPPTDPKLSADVQRRRLWRHKGRRAKIGVVGMYHRGGWPPRRIARVRAGGRSGSQSPREHSLSVFSI
ncbi:hypothetical protein C8Q76DRAFT_423309 [Earliella scabrosa]|nr:hypothetical protein C8Q76DRAFT_423309 [Earliella scabrosa]